MNKAFWKGFNEGFLGVAFPIACLVLASVAIGIGLATGVLIALKLWGFMP